MEMSVSQDQILRFRRLFGRLMTGVAVILATEKENLVGITVNTLTSVSLNPPLLLFCLRNESRSGEAILRIGRFTANVLAGHQERIARHFAGPRGNAAELEVVRQDGYAWFDHCNAVFRCEMQDVYPAGDHQIVIGRILQMLGPEGCAPLLVYQQGIYGHVEPRIDPKL